MLSEFQPYARICIHCKGVGYFCDDWDYANWNLADPDCVHEIEIEGEDDSKAWIFRREDK